MLRRGMGIAAGILCLLLASLATFAALDLWIVRSPAERTFVTTNIACLRCHADFIQHLDDKSVHQPVLTYRCTSCHTPHGIQSTTRTKPGDFASFRWLEDALRAVSLQVVWRVLTGPKLFGPRGDLLASAEETTTVQGPSGLVAPESQLCWTCHGDVGPRLASKYAHKPFAEGRCTACHDPHSSAHQGLLRADPAQLCTTCHAVGDQLVQSDVHPPFAKLQCLSCHAAHGSDNKGMLRVAQRDLCRTCHAAEASASTMAYQHAPFEKGDCTGCHRPHSSGLVTLLQATEPDLCYRCHDKVRPAFAATHHHSVGCSDCHQPHAAPQPHLLPVAQRDLCLGCHPSVRTALASNKFAHAPASKGDCTVCHTPHGSGWQGMLVDSQTVVCVRCHPNKAARPTDPRAGAPASSVAALAPAAAPAAVRRAGSAPPSPVATAAARPGRRGVLRVQGFVEPPTQMTDAGPRPAGPDPVTTKYAGPSSGTTSSTHPTGGSTGVECSACHEPHGSDFPGVLRTNVDQLCSDCHAPEAAAISRSAHKNAACTTCHEVHQSANPALLKADQPELCRRCHPEPNYVMHPASSAYWDFVANKPLSCTSTCHDPHGTPNYRMLRVDYNSNGKGSDYLCLLCHTEVGITY